ncbi:hypothetical protein [Streptomyces sp. S.PB5]|uniref:hypothetical protein n=1 Tax=Streptomyces sp. S.PB5 TaxID=3020844 RepID=UPI0025B21218|nr:hypothetical protein [Streptomyces sp. S.PB5]MDN3025736.1 hypothetical protein [Streptomyces sp. S.PB5]
MHSDPAAFVNVAEQVEPVAKKVAPSIEVDRLPVKYQTTDHTSVISKVKAAQTQAVVLILTSPEAAKSTLSPTKDATEGLKAVQLAKAPSDDDPAVKEFRTAMAEYEPGQTAGFLALWGWSNAKVLAEITKTVKGPVTSQALYTPPARD